MPKTMDKKDVLYRVKYKNMNSIKWGTITKLAGKEAPPDAKGAVGDLLNDEKNDEMELKVGMIRSGKKASLVLRVKNGKKHLYEKLLVKAYTPPSESKKGEFDTDQIGKLKLANAELDEAFDKTNTCLAALKQVGTQLGQYEQKTESDMSGVDLATIDRPAAFKLSSGFKVRLNLATRIKADADKLIEDHRKEIDGIRSGGATRIAKKHGLDENRTAEFAKRFVDHARVFAKAEQRAKSIVARNADLVTELRANLKLLETGSDKTAAFGEMLSESLVNWRSMEDAVKRNYFDKTELEKYLEFTAKTKNDVAIDGALKSVDTREKSVEKVLAKLNGLITSKVKKVPKPLHDNPGIETVLKDIGHFRTKFTGDVQTFNERCGRARTHLQRVMAELTS